MNDRAYDDDTHQKHLPFNVQGLAKDKLLETLFRTYGQVIITKELAEIFNCTRSDLSFIPEDSLPVVKGRGKGSNKYLLDHVVAHILGFKLRALSEGEIFDRLVTNYGVILKAKDVALLLKCSRPDLASIPESELPVANHIGRGVKRYMLSDVVAYLVQKWPPIYKETVASVKLNQNAFLSEVHA